MKLTDIIKEDKNYDFTSKQTGIDPVTGKISWDIEYSPLNNADESIEKAYLNIEKAVKDNPNDKILLKMLEVLGAFKKSFRTHVTKKYSN